MGRLLLLRAPTAGAHRGCCAAAAMDAGVAAGGSIKEVKQEARKVARAALKQLSDTAMQQQSEWVLGGLFRRGSQAVGARCWPWTPPSQ